MCHGQLYQQRMKKAFDKKVKPRVFREGDLVLKKVLSFAPDSRGKWTPNYEGSYVVKRAFSGGALMLTTMDGEDFTRPVNSDAIFVEIVPQTELLLGLFPSTVAIASRTVINIPTRVASGVVTSSPHAVCQQDLSVSSARLFSFEDSVSQWFDTRYFTFSPAKSSVELLLSLHQSYSLQQSRIYFPTQWLIGLVSQYSNHLILSLVCRMCVVAVLPVECSFNPQYGRMMALASSKRI
ncbi:hypothetical protein KIW84_031375 [Lathyrus oleraceus]|uniref:Uncharacterized protein n=1 Tax=Pisum sativum TaxID=3888 RepID=A0A9D4XS47_PEA|nr:hypothetical protein KIW84_031375 [Pisum sativum]